MPAARCAACAADHPWSWPSGSKPTSFLCKYIMRNSIGTVRGCNRTLYLVRGEATFASSDGDCLVRTAQTSEVNSEYYLQGAIFPFSQPDAPVYLGPPGLSAISQSGVRSTIRDLEWRDALSTGVWSR